ncbi:MULTISPECIES: ThiF family adenylyltransferase [unclassified Paenibacillus]|uniref:ThiF family adenylyltransferase n=1 Tax=Paenibacillus provencensis TaxID=441151 RepID=A0ABW3PYD2_9BACL|nr:MULTISPECIES: ThiF family adenylyltransferase [unclassified Paenibacillus]MCM3130175.1 ThiF family adenylyltransferase [Paenibacillus sp. MER 78]SDX71096.1 ThiF family protein [Paenibacillus sp. PDC88]SFS88487.1 ThiF family protein [Paenibacillus sp. 453mf]
MNAINVKEKNHVLFQICVVGAGGNGSHFVRTLLQTISGYLAANERPPISFDITLIDADRVEQKNFQRQLFDQDDLDEYKVVSLVERYADYYGLEVKAVTEFVTSLEMLANLFGSGDLNIGPNVQVVPILVGLVDNNKTRQLFDEFFHSDLIEDLIWIDAGIEGIMLFDDPSPAELQMIEFSGFGGQVVCGYKFRGETILEPVTRVYPNILGDEKTEFPGQSCGDTILNNPQRLQTNQMAAQLTMTLLNNLMDKQNIYFHKINFNAQFAQSKSTFIQKDIVEKFEALRK